MRTYADRLNVQPTLQAVGKNLKNLAVTIILNVPISISYHLKRIVSSAGVFVCMDVLSFPFAHECVCVCACTRTSACDCICLC